MKIVFSLLSAISLISGILSFLFIDRPDVEIILPVFLNLLGGLAWYLVGQMWEKVGRLEQKLASMGK